MLLLNPYLLKNPTYEVTIATKEWGNEFVSSTLPVKGLSERSYHKGLFLHVTPSTPDGMSRMQVYLDCKWQGYFMMPLSLFQMAKEAAGNKLRAVSSLFPTSLFIIQFGIVFVCSPTTIVKEGEDSIPAEEVACTHFFVKLLPDASS
ncbi:uncharacterized protein CEXT_503751 [Caerostris extrusa]|uniref:Uncharacterized protein n=1 Tax=Caerostris extrusa TaxID=172846 RepID=A0AAV4X082_CAEEX|nr:uncharacterized protein CEXT_503751 [Caerostris extrusa]